MSESPLKYSLHFISTNTAQHSTSKELQRVVDDLNRELPPTESAKDGQNTLCQSMLSSCNLQTEREPAEQKIKEFSPKKIPIDNQYASVVDIEQSTQENIPMEQLTA